MRVRRAVRHRCLVPCVLFLSGAATLAAADDCPSDVRDGALPLSVSFDNNEEALERTVGAIRQELGGKPAHARVAAPAKS